MTKNHKLAKAIQDCAWGELFRQIKYKAEWGGRIMHKVNRFFPSSKTCNGCQHKLDKLPLDKREWWCPSCGQYNDRDLNAALNIRDKGIEDLKKTGLWNVVPAQKLGEAPLEYPSSVLGEGNGSLNQDTKI